MSLSPADEDHAEQLARMIGVSWPQAKRDAFCGFLEDLGAHIELPDNRQDLHRPWHDAAGGFGGRQRQLLALLDQADAAVDHVLTSLWPGDNSPRASLCRRLRSLVLSTNRRLHRLNSTWLIFRPSRGKLALTVNSAGRVRVAA